MGTRLGSLVALVVLALAAFVSATYDGPAWETGLPRIDRSTDTAESTPSPQREESGTDREESEPEDPPGLDTVPGSAPRALLVGILVIALLIGVAIVAGLRLALRRRRLSDDVPPRSGASRPPEEAPEEDEAEDPGESISLALHELDVGEPRNAIVATWLQLERLLHSERFGRHPADTPSSYAERARSSYGLDADALDELATLYREARFSRHPLTAAHRERARDCLTRLRTDLEEHTP